MAATFTVGPLRAPSQPSARPIDSRFAALWNAARGAHDAARGLADAELTERTREAVRAIARAVGRFETITGSAIMDWRIEG